MMIEMVVDDDGSDMLNTMVSLGNDLHSSDHSDPQMDGPTRDGSNPWREHQNRL